MRLVYTADLHGDLAGYRQLLELAVATQASVAIVGGDLLPHAMRTDTALEQQRTFAFDLLMPLLAEFRAVYPELRLFLLPGNDDWAAAAQPALEAFERASLAWPLHERVYDLAALGLSQQPLWLAGYACVPITPFSIKDYERRDDGPFPAYGFAQAFSSMQGTIAPVSAKQIAALPGIRESLMQLAEHSPPDRTIYVCHTPPYDTPLDMMMGDRHPGSRALRRFIEHTQPPITMHGHIHEAPYLSGQFATRIGRTWAFNPGRDQRRFHAITLDTEEIEATLAHTVFENRW